MTAWGEGWTEDERILFTLDGRGEQAKREAYVRMAAASRRAALEEAARLADGYCASMGSPPPEIEVAVKEAFAQQGSALAATIHATGKRIASSIRALGGSHG